MPFDTVDTAFSLDTAVFDELVNVAVTTNRKKSGNNLQLVEEEAGHVDVVSGTASTLVLDSSSSGLTLVGDLDLLSTVWVGVAKRAHEVDGESNGILAVGVDVGTASAEATVVEGDFTGARRAGSTGAAVGAVSTANWWNADDWWLGSWWWWWWRRSGRGRWRSCRGRWRWRRSGRGRWRRSRSRRAGW